MPIPPHRTTNPEATPYFFTASVEPAAALPRLGEHLAQPIPEAQRPVADGQHRGAHAAAGAIAQQIRPRFGGLPVANRPGRSVPCGHRRGPRSAPAGTACALPAGCSRGSRPHRVRAPGCPGALPSEPCVRLVGAHGSSRPLGRVGSCPGVVGRVRDGWVPACAVGVYQAGLIAGVAVCLARDHLAGDRGADRVEPLLPLAGEVGSGTGVQEVAAAGRAAPPLPRQPPFGARHQVSYTASYTQPTTLEGAVTRPRFPAAFRPPPFASWAYDSRHRYPLPLRSAYHSTRVLDCDGVPMFRTCEIRPGLGALCTPGPWSPHDRPMASGRHRRFPTAGPHPRFLHSISRGSLLTRRHQGFRFNPPVRHFP
jgi:hypothetical protein